MSLVINLPDIVVMLVVTNGRQKKKMYVGNISMYQILTTDTQYTTLVHSLYQHSKLTSEQIQTFINSDRCSIENCCVNISHVGISEWLTYKVRFNMLNELWFIIHKFSNVLTMNEHRSSNTFVSLWNSFSNKLSGIVLM